MVTTIRKLTGGTHPFYEYACLSTDVKPVSLVPENSLCIEIDTGKKFYFSDGAWHEAPSRGGGSGDGGSSLPSMTGKNGKVLGVTLDAQDHEQAEWVTAPSGLPDGFPAEAAGNANKFIGFDASGDYEAKDAPSSLPSVSSTENGKVLKVAEGAWIVGDEATELPAHTASNNGQVLGLENNAPAWTTPVYPEYFDVTLTIDAQNNVTVTAGTGTSYSAINAAMTAGKPCYFRASFPAANVVCYAPINTSSTSDGSYVAQDTYFIVNTPTFVIISVSSADAYTGFMFALSTQL